MNLGIAGSGMIVKEALPIFQQLNINVLGIWGRNETNLQNLAQTYKINQYYTQYQALLDNPQIDTIYVAVPNKYHHQFAKEALLQGKNVICEKPFTNTIEEFLELRQIAQARKLILLEAITTYYLPALERVKKLLAQNKLGQLHLANLNFSQYSSRYDNFKQGIIAPVFDPQAQGGVLRDLNIYNIHFLCSLFGKPKQIAYYPQIEQNIDTSGQLILEFPEILATATASKSTSCQTFVNIQGEKGSLLIHKAVNELGDITIIQRGKNITLYSSQQDKHRMYYEFQTFQQIIANKDHTQAQQALDHSQIVMEVLDQASQALKKQST